MHRLAQDYLKEWKDKEKRKPLVLRGARQVGKTYLVENFARESFETLVKIDFEKTREAASLFDSKSPKTILPLLEAKWDTKIQPGKTLLFLDEIQAAPDVFAALRYFHEDMPALHVIAAGSLLEFILAEHAFSMPVGRIEYLHLGPMQFEEFLIALQREKLREVLCQYKVGDSIHPAIHADLMGLIKQYLVVGGMPEAIDVYAKTNSFRECAAVQQSILSTYRDDFNKYSKRANPLRLEKVFGKVPQMVGQKFKYSRVDIEEKARDLRMSLRMLSMARVAIPVFHSSANGVPLMAQMDELKFKVLFLDVGLLCRSCGLGIYEFEKTQDVMMINTGAVCEQFIGQHLLYSRPFYDEAELFYWIREKKMSNAEVDYLICLGPDIIPVEVKSGKSGTLKSLQVFLCEKGRDLGIRFNSDLPSFVTARTSLSGTVPTPFRLLSLPLYMVGQTKRLCSDIAGMSK